MKLLLSLVTFATSALLATPTSVFWTNCTTDVQAAKTLHIDGDLYFSVGNRTKNGSSFPPDIGLLGGLFSWNNVSAEAGADYICGISHPWLFNGKIGIDENKLFEYAPSMSIGVFNLGTTRDTNLAVADGVIGHSLPYNLGRLFLGGYYGKRALGTIRSGWMAAYQKGFFHEHDAEGTEYDKWEFNADYASGKNAIGGGGVAMSYYFTPKIFIESGPVWFRDHKANGRWKWSVQFNFDL